MITGVLLVLVIGFMAGKLASLARLPKLIGMLLAGIAAGPSLLNVLPEAILDVSNEIRMFVLLVILLKAGLGLDKRKIVAEGSVAIRLGFLPATIEASVVAVAARLILGWDWLNSWLLGWIICAASPAVIVPMMLKLKAEGWGVKKGIPDLILAGGTASDAVAVTLFGIFLAWILDDGSSNTWMQLSLIPIQIVLGIVFGFIAGKTSVLLIKRFKLAANPVDQGVILLAGAMTLVVGDSFAPYSAFLAVMVMGFVVLETDMALARRLRHGMDRIWVVGEIFLFVLIGAAVDIRVIAEAGAAGLGIIVIGLVVGRWAGIFLSTWFSTITIRERFFMVVGDMAKATVQAAIGGIPLAMGLPNGEYILAIAVLSILLSAPLGAFGTAYLAPKMLEKGEIDPTKVNVQDHFRFLVVTSGSTAPQRLIRETARIARRVDAELVFLNVHPDPDKLIDPVLLKEELYMARDVDHKVILVEGDIVQTILDTANRQKVDYIYLSGQTGKSGTKETTTAVVEKSDIPVVIIDESTDDNPDHKE